MITFFTHPGRGDLVGGPRWAPIMEPNGASARLHGIENEWTCWDVSCTFGKPETGKPEIRCSRNAPIARGDFVETFLFLISPDLLSKQRFARLHGFAKEVAPLLPNAGASPTRPPFRGVNWECFGNPFERDPYTGGP